jgi:tetratricopeptide (TPR) repeat protein
MWYDGQRDHVKSAETHRHYLEIVESLYAADPKNMVLKQEVVIGSANLAIEIGFLGQRNESERLLDKAVTLMRSIVQAAPQNTSHQGILAAALAMRGDNFLYWKEFKHGLDDYGAASGIYRQLLAANPKNTAAQQRLFICRIVMAHTKLQTGSPRANAELQRALTDSNPLLSDANLHDDTLYAAAVGYADLGNIDFAAARNPAAARQSHWKSAAHWYGLSLSTLKRVRDLAGQSESEAFGALDPAVISKRLAICQSAVRPASAMPAH